MPQHHVQSGANAGFRQAASGISSSVCVCARARARSHTHTNTHTHTHACTRCCQMEERQRRGARQQLNALFAIPITPEEPDSSSKRKSKKRKLFRINMSHSNSSHQVSVVFCLARAPQTSNSNTRNDTNTLFLSPSRTFRRWRRGWQPNTGACSECFFSLARCRRSSSMEVLDCNLAGLLE